MDITLAKLTLFFFIFQLSCGANVEFLPYLVDANSVPVVVENSTLPQDMCMHPEKGMSLYYQLKKRLIELQKENM